MTTSNYSGVYWGAQEMAVAALMLYLTIISGYLIVAFAVGAGLDRPRLIHLDAV